MIDNATPWLRRPIALAAACAAVAALSFTAGCEDDDDAELEIETLTPVAFQVDADGMDDDMDDDMEDMDDTEPQVRRGQIGQATTETQGDGITITKTAPEQIVLGQSITYTINVENTAGEISNLVVTEELPEGFEFESSEPEPTRRDGNMLTYRVARMPAGEGGQIRITGTPQETGDLQACTSYEIDRGVCAAFTVVNPDLRLTKMGPDAASVCTQVEYVYTLENSGDTEANDVVIYDALPEGMMLADGGDEVNIEVGSLAPGQKVEERVMVKGSQPEEVGSYAIARSDLVEVKSKTVQTEFTAPDLQVSARPDRPTEYINRAARFEVQVRNTGDVPADQVVLATAVSENGQIARVYSGQQADGEERMAGGRELADGDALLGTLQPGESRSIFVDVRPEDIGTVKFAAVAQAVCRDSGTELARAQATAQISVEAVSALQLEVVDSVDPVQVGGQTVYEITIINEGQAEDRNLTVSAELPEGAVFADAQGATDLQGEGGQTVSFAPVDVLPAGESVTWYVTIDAESANNGGQFKVTVNSDNSGEEILENEPTRLY